MKRVQQDDAEDYLLPITENDSADGILAVGVLLIFLALILFTLASWYFFGPYGLAFGVLISIALLTISFIAVRAEAKRAERARRESFLSQ